MNFTTKQTTRIHGTYSIVSVFEADAVFAQNKKWHERVMAELLSEGFTVTQLQGVYKGALEYSIRIEGVGHHKAARSAAETFGQ